MEGSAKDDVGSYALKGCPFFVGSNKYKYPDVDK